MSFPVVLARAKPHAKPCFPGTPLAGAGHLSCRRDWPFGARCQGIPRLRAPSSLSDLTDLRGQGELAAGGIDLRASKSSLGQLQVLQVEVWGSLGWGAPKISPYTVGLTLAFPFPRAGRFFSVGCRADQGLVAESRESCLFMVRACKVGGEGAEMHGSYGRVLSLDPSMALHSEACCSWATSCQHWGLGEGLLGTLCSP